MATYATTRRTDGRRRLYTYHQRTAELVMFTLGDERLEAVSTEEVGRELLYTITYQDDAHHELEAVLVTRGCVEVETLALPESLLEGLDAEAELEGSIARHPANGERPIAELKVGTFESCYPCKVNARLSLAACLGSFAAACIALAAVLVAS